MTDTSSRGDFAWYDLMSPDPEASKAFYTKLIGWTITPFEGSPEPYDMWTVGETPVGGVMTLPAEAKAAGAPPHWLAYVLVDNAAAALKKAEDLGGSSLHPETDIPNVGKFGILRDPQGAVMAVFTPVGDAPPAEDVPGPGRMSWHELMTTDHEAAFAFYSALFGWEKDEAMDMGEAGLYQMFKNGGPPLGGIFNKPPQVPAANWLFYIKVKNVDESVEQARALGARVLHGPTEVPGGDRIVQCLDPQGAAFALHSSAG